MDKFTYEEVFKSTLEYFNGDYLATSTAINKYLLKDKEGSFLEKSPEDLHNRLAVEFARIEKKLNPNVNEAEYFQKIRKLLEKFRKIVPQGSPMAAIGNQYSIQSLSNCLVVSSPKDSMSGIFNTGLELAEICKRRGGVGIDLSTLRPSGTKVNNAASIAGGTPDFADFYSHVTRMIGQKSRQGALMLTLDIAHPDSELFTIMKQDLKKVTGANISLKITDAFMKAVENNEDFVQRWPVDVPPSKAKVVKIIKARELWNTIVDSAWRTAEPGILMWDNYCNNLPAHGYEGFKSVSTNPCSEILLSPYDSCRLISNNLYGWVKNPFTKEAFFDFEEYFNDTRVAQRMSDGLVELELEAISRIMVVSDDFGKSLWGKIYDAGKNGRRTGLGTHGLADTLLALGLKYDSKEALQMVDKIYQTHRDAAYTETVELAKERGSFPVWDWDIDKKCVFIQRLPENIKQEIQKHGRRNIACLTCAPTGSTSIISQVSSGIESVFRWVYDRRMKINSDIAGKFPVDFVDDSSDKWTKFRVVHPVLKEYFKVNNLQCPIDESTTTISLDSSQKKLKEILPAHFVTSDEIDYFAGIELQAAITRYLDHGASRTINLPKGTTKEQVSDIYMKSWKAGLKGVTVYVDGCRDGVLLASDEKKEPQRPITIIDNHAPNRPQSLPADIHRVKIKGNDWLVVVGLLHGRPYEVFAGKMIDIPKQDDIESAFIKKTASKKYILMVQLKENGIEKIADLKEIYDTPEQRTITLSVCKELRHGIPIEFICKDLYDHEGTIVAYASVLARVLKKYAKNLGLIYKSCSNCGSKEFEMKEGCMQCVSCGMSKCN